MPRGRKKTHKGGHRHFSNEEQIAAEKARLEKEKEWRRQKGIESSEEEEEEEKGGATAAAANRPDPMNRDFPPSESESEEESDEEEEKAKGVSHLIEIENPNHVKQKAKKVTELDGKAELSRREREELDKQKAKEHYQRMHLAGKTDEARADLARLALIRKQREDAQRKKEEEAKSRDQAKNQAEKKLLEKRQASK